ncbi:hypothetical protein RvY_12271 [Ramazzottius varieornatus]|uniref:Uncharacterized protein n=1 Tax=Ramazzottius varieornatus TaxID=947166 RepID=A0A1D1VIY5_RAMVA|nr:hypothetical protein RvY_12271 [Ramazzottius varieornatus]
MKKLREERGVTKEGKVLARTELYGTGPGQCLLTGAMAGDALLVHTGGDLWTSRCYCHSQPECHGGATRHHEVLAKVCSEGTGLLSTCPSTDPS